MDLWIWIYLFSSLFLILTQSYLFSTKYLDQMEEMIWHINNVSWSGSHQANGLYDQMWCLFLNGLLL